MQVTNTIRTEVLANVEKFYQKAERYYGRTFTRPTVLFTKKGRAAGTASLHSDTINYNPVLLMENQKEFMETTVPHEVAHLVDYQLRGTSNHDAHWKSVMVSLGAKPNRCHSFDVENSARHKSKFVYKCTGCEQEVVMGPVRHKKMVRQPGLYSHSTCRGSKLVFLRDAGRVSHKSAKEGKAPTSHKRPTDKLPTQPSQTRAPSFDGSTMSKKERAKMMYRPGIDRSMYINALMNQLNMTKAGASTYYSNFKSNRW